MLTSYFPKLSRLKYLHTQVHVHTQTHAHHAYTYNTHTHTHTTHTHTHTHTLTHICVRARTCTQILKHTITITHAIATGMIYRERTHSTLYIAVHYRIW